MREEKMLRFCVPLKERSLADVMIIVQWHLEKYNLAGDVGSILFRDNIRMSNPEHAEIVKNGLVDVRLNISNRKNESRCEDMFTSLQYRIKDTAWASV